MDKILVFDIEGYFAHFRKGYTTTSPITYDFPPRTVLIGMLGAILGHDENTYIKNFSLERCKIGIRILKSKNENSGYKIRLKENWREGPGGKAEMRNVSQVGLEILRYPSYRIYLSHVQEEILEDLRNYLSRGESVFNPYLGIKEFICDIRFNDIYSFERGQEKHFKEIVSVIPEKPEYPYTVTDIDDTKMQNYILRRDIVPNETLKGREFKRIAVLYEANGKPLWVKPKQDIIFIPNINERIIFLE